MGAEAWWGGGAGLGVSERAVVKYEVEAEMAVCWEMEMKRGKLTGFLNVRWRRNRNDYFYFMVDVSGFMVREACYCVAHFWNYEYERRIELMIVSSA